MTGLVIKNIKDLPQTPLSRGIKAGDVAIHREYFPGMPAWIKEFFADMQVPYIVAALTVVALIAFSFGMFMQQQLYNEATFLLSALHFDPQIASKQWL